MTEIFTQREVNIPRKEVLRYMGYHRVLPDEPVDELLDSCMEEFCAHAGYSACRVRADVHIEGRNVNFGAFSVESALLSRNMAGCETALLMAATAGARPDRLIARYRLSSPARALVLDAIGSAAVEAWCNYLCDRWREEFATQGLRLRPRYSPGYGDFPLSAQGELLQTLDAAHRAGISLTKSTMMTPTKSVSAVIGLGVDGCTSREHDCENCSMADCQFRR